MAMVARTCSHPKMRDELQSNWGRSSVTCSHPKMRDELQSGCDLLAIQQPCSHPKMRDELQSEGVGANL